MTKDMLFFHNEKNIMDSENIFEFSDEFLQEIINDLIKLKSKKLSNPKNNEFEKKLKSLIGKNFSEKEIGSLSLGYTLFDITDRVQPEKELANL